MSQFFSYYQRVLVEAWRETLAFAKRRLVFGVLMGAVVSTASWKFGLVHQIPNVLIRGLTVLVGSYATVFLAAFIVKLVEAPVSVDKKSAEQIAELGARINSQENKNELRARFVGLMEEGEALADDLRRGVAQAHYGRWLDERRQWRDRVNQALVDNGFEIEAAAFRHASEPMNFNPPAGQVADGPYYRRLYGEELERSRTTLRDTVQERMGLAAQ